MANYQLSYKDYIRKLQRQTSIENKKLLSLKTINEYSDFLYDISDITLDPLAHAYMFKKNNINEYKYVYSDNNIINQIKKNNDVFKNSYNELTGTYGLLSVYFNIKVDDDFMTGYYIAKALIKNRKTDICSFYFGYNKPNLLLGIKYQFG